MAPSEMIAEHTTLVGGSLNGNGILEDLSLLAPDPTAVIASNEKVVHRSACSECQRRKQRVSIFTFVIRFWFLLLYFFVFLY